MTEVRWDDLLKPRCSCMSSFDGEGDGTCAVHAQNPEHPFCPYCMSDQTDILTDPLGIEPTTIECHDCGTSALVRAQKPTSGDAQRP
jgi:hypothetical protein